MSAAAAYKIKDSALHCLWKIKRRKEVKIKEEGDRLIMWNL